MDFNENLLDIRFGRAGFGKRDQNVGGFRVKASLTGLHSCRSTRRTPARLRHDGFSLSRRELQVPHLVGNSGLFLRRELREVVEMTLRKRHVRRFTACPGLNIGRHVVMNREQLADFAFRFAGYVREFLLRQSMFITEASQRIGGFERTQIDPLPVMDDLVNENVFAFSGLNTAWEFRETKCRRGGKTAAAVDDHVFSEFDIPSHGQGLLDAACSNRRDQLLKFAVIEKLPRLAGICDHHSTFNQICVRETSSALLIRRSGRSSRLKLKC